MNPTVKEFIDELKKYPPDREMYFGGLDFYRFKDRDAVLQVEFSQTVYKNENGDVVVENH